MARASGGRGGSVEDLPGAAVRADPKTYGAVGDGVTDDTDALQACIDAGGGLLAEGGSVRAPEDTSKADPGGLLAEAAVLGPARAIEAQEARGQAQLVAGDVLPAAFTGRYEIGRAGVVFLGPVEGDPLFERVRLPTGWSKRPCKNSMWSDLVDDRGRVRAKLFYKAAFYDRQARGDATCRFTIEHDFDLQTRDGVEVSRVLDCGVEVFATDPAPSDPGFESFRAAQATAEEWLWKHRPRWRDPAAYWDEEAQVSP